MRMPLRSIVRNGHLMPQSPLRLTIITRDDSPRVQSAWASMEQFLRQRKSIEIAEILVGEEIDPPTQPSDLAVVLGGDGAILRACRGFGLRQMPIVGINLGRLGFLADLSPDEFRQQIHRLESRDYRVVHHLMLECEHRRADGSVRKYLGLNEAAIHAGGSLSMIDVELSVGGVHVTTYSADGLILSTPVGSTAHSLSAGGPILQQDLQAFVITPISPHTLSNRPLVDSADHEYRLTLPNVPAGVMLTVDGQIREPLTPGDEIFVRRAAVSFQLVRLSGHSYYKTLNQKLGWGGQPRYQRNDGPF
jgi:NAD+ kinase